MYKYKFPPRLFKDVEVIDFGGAGTGHKQLICPLGSKVYFGRTMKKI